MAFLRRNNRTPESRAIETSAHRVIETAQETDLDPETTLIMGGAALALAGIRPAGDVDLIIPETAYDAIRRSPPYATPSGMRLRQKSGAIYPVFETYGRPPRKDIMHVDITTPRRDYGGDAQFLHELKSYESIEGFRFLPPALVLARKLRSAERNRAKDRKDIELIRQHLAEEQGRK